MSTASWKHQFVETKVMPPIHLVEYFGRPVVKWEGKRLRTLAVLNPTSSTDGKSLDLESLDDDKLLCSTKEYSGLIQDKDMDNNSGEQKESGRTVDKQRNKYTNRGKVYDANHFRIIMINNDGGCYEFRGYNELEFKKTDFRPFVVDWLIINQIEKLFEVTEVRRLRPLGWSGRSRRPLVSVKYVEQGRGIPCVKIPPEKITINAPTKRYMRSKTFLGQKSSFLLYEPNAVVDVRSFFKENLGLVRYYKHHYSYYAYNRHRLGHYAGAFNNWLKRWQEYSRVYYPILVNSESPFFCNDPQKHKHYCPTCHRYFGPKATLVPYYNYINDSKIVMKNDNLGDLYNYAFHDCLV